MYCVKAEKAIYWVFLVYNECFFGISPSYGHLDFKERLSSFEMSRGEWANLRKCNWSEWTFQDTKGTVRRTTLEFGEPPRSPITTYSKKKPVALQLAVCTQARHGSWGRLEPFSEEPFVFSAKHILPKISTFHWKAIVLSMETNFFS